MKKKILLIEAVFLSVLIFILDLNTELGVAGGVPYILVVLLGLFYREKKFFIYSGLAGIVLTVAGYYLSPAGGELYKVLLNRFYAVLAISATSILGYLIIIKEEQFELSKRNFKKQVESEINLSGLLSQAKDTVYYDQTYMKALKIFLDNVCEITNWPLGHIYLVDDNQKSLTPAKIWSVRNEVKYREFMDVTESITFEKGVGLPGLVLEKGAPVFISNVMQDSNFPRARLLRQKSIVGAFAIPCITKGRVRSVLEFYSDKEETLDISMQEVINEASEQISRVIEKWEYELSLKEKVYEAEKANNAKSEFLMRMSHELRTPLNAILGFSQLMEMDSQESLPKKHRQNLDYIISAGKHLLELINEVLDLSRIESGNMELSIENVDMIPIVDNVISLSKSMAIKKGISLEYQKVPEGNYFVEVDPIRFKQVVLNLVSNAIKYNKPNGSVFVSFEKHDSDMVRLGIRDTGHGIAEDKRDRLFKPFERFDVDLEQIEGTGIGLSIAKQLVELMSGTIGYESKIGEGTFFYVDIPLSKKIPLIQIEEKEETTQLISTKIQKKIIYIEDISANVDLLRQIFKERQEIRLISASSARTGIELVKTEIPDLILMDIHMVEMDGLTAFKELQKINTTKDIPVIALTANAMGEEVKKALDLGFKDYITKPIDIPKFLEKIERVLL